MKIAYRLLIVLLISTFLFACGGKKEGGVNGKVINGQDQPLSGVIVTFNPVQMTPDAKQPQTRTGGDGSFKMTELVPASEYIITFEGEKWTSKVTRKIQAPGGRQPLALDGPVVIRFQLLKDGTIIDTKTGLQWLIHTAPDTNANNVASIVDTVDQGGFNDWRLPAKSEIAGLQDPTATADEEGPKISTKACCVWTKEINSDKIEWDFYIEDKSDLWTSSRMPANDRVVVARTSGAASPIAQARAVIVPAPAPVSEPTAVAPPVTVTPSQPATEIIKPKQDIDPFVIYFEANKITITKEGLEKLKEFYTKVKDADGSILIEGHSNAPGGKIAVMKDSSDIAMSAFAELKKMGLSDKIKVEVKNVGDEKPLADNKTAEGKMKNRRVEVIFTPG